MTAAPLPFVERAVGHRHGVFRPPMDIPVTAADPLGVAHASVGREGEEPRSAGGGVARSAVAARTAAVAEALERYAAVHARLPVRRRSMVGDAPAVSLAEWTLHSERQRARPAYPHRHVHDDDEWMTPCFDLLTNAPVWVPAALVGLTERFGAFATSSGLAADTDSRRALLRALQELVERDAFVTTWLHGLGGRLVADRPIDDLPGSRMRVFDLTPAFSPHPVAAVTGTLMLEGRPRHSLGLACRARWPEAVERAELEMLQGTLFVGHTLRRRPDLMGMPAEAVTGFDEHALFYSANPELWEEIPLHRWSTPAPAPVPFRDSPVPPSTSAPASPPNLRGPEISNRTKPDDREELRSLVGTLTRAGVRLLYRDLTTVDVSQLGLTVVRVLSPDLTPLHHDHRWPFLGGRAGDVAWRYPDRSGRQGATTFPSPFPHPLG